MSENENGLSFWSAKFASAALEREYQAATEERHFRLNLISSLSAVLLFALYGIFDLEYFDYPLAAIMVRVGVTAVCIVALLSLRLASNFQQKQTIFMLVCTSMGLGVDVIISLYPDQHDLLYVALIQGAVLFGFLLKLDFPRFVFLSLCSYVGFLAATYPIETGYTEDLFVRAITLLQVMAICLVGVYFLQRYHRRDFFQARTIDQQNEKLSEMLNDVRRDNERKIAAMNLLVHFVRTPVHQISGFTDIVINSLKSSSDVETGAQSVESAEYIKDASTDLKRNVTNLLDYHRLDDVERTIELDHADIVEHVTDAVMNLNDEDVRIERRSPINVTTKLPALNAAVGQLTAFNLEALPEGEKLEVGFGETDDSIEVVFTLAGEEIPASEFKTLIRPITEIDDYLTFGGSSIPMALRTVARAIDVIAGRFTYTHEQGQNCFVLTLPKNLEVHKAA